MDKLLRLQMEKQLQLILFFSHVKGSVSSTERKASIAAKWTVKEAMYISLITHFVGKITSISEVLLSFHY